MVQEGKRDSGSRSRSLNRFGPEPGTLSKKGNNGRHRKKNYKLTVTKGHKGLPCIAIIAVSSVTRNYDSGGKAHCGGLPARNANQVKLTMRYVEGAPSFLGSQGTSVCKVQEKKGRAT